MIKNNIVYIFFKVLGIFSIALFCMLLAFSLFTYFLKVHFGLTITSACILYGIIFAIVCTYKYAERFFYRVLRRYSREYALTYFHEIDTLSERMHSILSLKELSNSVVNTLVENFNLRRVSLLTFDSDIKQFILGASYGFAIADLKMLSIPQGDLAIELLKEKRTIVKRDLLVRMLPWQESTRVRHTFIKLSSRYMIPIFYDEYFIGILTLSLKKNGKDLSWQELKRMKKFSQELSSPLRNAQVFNELQKKTEELKGIQSRLLQNGKIIALEQLAAGIAHEIHNPLTIISGKAQVLLLKGAKGFDKNRVEEVLLTIVQQTKRAAEITRRLLMFAQPHGGDDIQIISVEDIIADTIALVSYQTSLDQIKIQKRIEDHIPSFHGHVFEIRELFLNLILNAIQAIGKEGEIIMTVQYIQGKNALCIRISDTGIGIPEDKLGVIFDPFYTTKSGSVGLGLFVCQQIIKRHRGEIRIDSKEGVGSVVVVTIPIQEVPKQTVSSESDSKNTKYKQRIKP